MVWTCEGFACTIVTINCFQYSFCVEEKGQKICVTRISSTLRSYREGRVMYLSHECYVQRKWDKGLVIHETAGSVVTFESEKPLTGSRVGTRLGGWRSVRRWNLTVGTFGVAHPCRLPVFVPYPWARTLWRNYFCHLCLSHVLAAMIWALASLPQWIENLWKHESESIFLPLSCFCQVLWSPAT